MKEIMGCELSQHVRREISNVNLSITSIVVLCCLSGILSEIFATASENVSFSGERLACLTAYWPSEGDHWTSDGKSSTGIPLRNGVCAVDPRIIPYGSTVFVPGQGKLLAVDTGTAVVSRRAAKRLGTNSEQRNALVIDIFFNSKAAAKDFIKNAPRFTLVRWSTSNSLVANNATSP